MRIEGSTKPLVYVQFLRGLAALLVLAGHAQGLATSMAARGGEMVSGLRFPGGFGVDLFFCISGFIMVISSRSLFARPGGRAEFLRRRAIRLVPLYWIATGLFVLTLVLGRRGYDGNLPVAIVTSLLFVPYPTYGFDQGMVFPLHNLGWSLNYEVFFYAVFAVFLAWPMQRAVAGVIATIVAVVALGLAFAPDATVLRFWSQPIVLEFAFGAAAGWVWSRGHRAGRTVVVACVLAAVALLFVDPLGLTAARDDGHHTTPNDLVRAVAWGIPALLLLVAAICRDPVGEAGLVTRLFERLGDCSYSLYLMHPFALIVVAKAWTVLGLDRFLAWWMLGVLGIAISIAVALASFRWIEKPLTRLLRDRRSPTVGLAPGSSR